MDNNNLNNDQPEEPTQMNPLLTPSPQPIEPKKSRKKVFLIVLLVAILGGGAALAYMNFSQKKESPTSVTPPQKDILANTNPVVCASQGHTNLQCENIETKELVKYELPKDLQQITDIFPSPDGKHFLVYKWSDESREIAVLYDRNFKELKSLFRSDKTATRSVAYQWISTGSLLQIDQTELTVDSISLKTLQPKRLGKITPGEKYTYGFTFLGAEQGHLYALTQIDNKETDSAEDVVVDISLTDFKVANLTFEDPKEASEQSLGDKGYRADIDKFLMYKNAPNNSGLVVFEANQSGTSPKFHKIQETKITPAISISVGGYVITSKGILSVDADSQGGVEKEDSPFYVTNSHGERSKLQLVNESGMIVSLPEFPNLKKASANKPQLTDYLKVPANTPPKIRVFAEERAKTNCEESPFRRVEVITFDGVNQVNLHETGCGRGASYYYILTNGKYKEVMGSQEGIGCDERDRLGLTPVVAPACRKPGEPL